MSLPRVVLKPKRAQPFFARHPWVFAGAVDMVSGAPAPGAEVEVVSNTGTFIARGLYNPHSKIRVRLYSWEPNVALDRPFFRDRLERAIRLRRDLLKLNGPDRGWRVAFSEADGLSGMVVDKYGDWLAVQFTSLALAERRDMIADVLRELLSPRGIYVRTEKGIGKLEGLELHDHLLWGESPPVDLSIDEGGLRFLVNLAEGQKTGYYLDQRDNRRFVADLSPGRRVLDAFSYTGGFGLHAARAGAAEVVCVDASESALALAERNAVANGLSPVSFVRGDVFRTLTDLAEKGERFGVVVLDPPKFARNRDAVPDAMKGYRRLMALGLKLLGPDGVLVFCCCTGLITMDMLEELFAQVAAEAKRDVQIVARRGPAADHPVALSCREGAYLKCVVARVA